MSSGPHVHLLQVHPVWNCAPAVSIALQRAQVLRLQVQSSANSQPPLCASVSALKLWAYCPGSCPFLAMPTDAGAEPLGAFTSAVASSPQDIQSLPNSSLGWEVAMLPLPHRISSARQYKSQPQQTLSGLDGVIGKRLLIRASMRQTKRIGSEPAQTQQVRLDPYVHRNGSQFIALPGPAPKR